MVRHSKVISDHIPIGKKDASYVKAILQILKHNRVKTSKVDILFSTANSKGLNNSLTDIGELIGYNNYELYEEYDVYE